MRHIYNTLLKNKIKLKVKFFIKKLNKLNDTKVTEDIKVIFSLTRDKKLGWFDARIRDYGLVIEESSLHINLYYYLKNKTKYFEEIIPHLVCHYYLYATADNLHMKKLTSMYNNHTKEFLNLCSIISRTDISGKKLEIRLSIIIDLVLLLIRNILK